MVQSLKNALVNIQHQIKVVHPKYCECWVTAVERNSVVRGIGQRQIKAVQLRPCSCEYWVREVDWRVLKLVKGR